MMKILRYLLIQILACLIITSYSIGQSTLTVANGGKMKVTSGTSVQQQNLNIGSGSQLVNRGDLTVNGVLANYAGTPGLIMKADENGNGSLLHTTPLVQATVEQFLTSERWHLVSPPVTNETIEPYLDIYLKQWHESTATWEYLTQPLSIPMVSSRGYSAWASDAFTGPSTVQFEGSLAAGNRPVTNLDYSFGSPQAGWCLVGNPYPSYLDWNGTWNMGNIGGWAVVYENGIHKGWNPYLPADQQSYNGKTNGIIAPSQGFWVRALDVNPYITIPQGARTHESETFYKENTGKNTMALNISVSANGFTDNASILFLPDGTTGFDGLYELEKHWNVDDAPSFYSSGAGGNPFAVNVLPENWFETDDDLMIPLGLKLGINVPCKLEVYGIETLGPWLPVFLEDKNESVYYDLLANPVYEFANDPQGEPNRFVLHFTNPQNIHAFSSPNIQVYTWKNNLVVRIPEGETGQAIMYDLLGSEVMTIPLNSALTTKQTGITSGHYIVHINTGSNAFAAKVYIKN